jgi:glycosylphosphatidylinositol deacylase
MSFAESLNQCLRRDVPICFTILVFFAMYLSGSGYSDTSDKPHWYDQYKGNSTEAMSDYTMNNLLIGSPDPFFWFLVPLFGIISIGLCIVINYFVLAVTHGLAFLYSRIPFFCSRIEESRYDNDSLNERVLQLTLLDDLPTRRLP